MTQDAVFLAKEADSWFRRNKETILAASRLDWPLHVIERLEDRASLRNVAELGCANGWRLARLKSLLPDAELVGVDPSCEAIADGTARYPGLRLVQAMLSNVLLEKQFDLVIVSFVFHWVDRSTLAKSMAEVDRVTQDGGYLVIADFLPDYPQRRKYHHCPEDVYTFKQDYPRMFESLGTYRETARITFGHSGKELSFQAVESGDRCVCSVLKKSLSGYYPLVP